MATYRNADAGDIALLAEMQSTHHRDLVEAGVTVGLLAAHAPRDKNTGEPKGQALSLHGYPCWATVKINSLRDRVEGKADATVTIDGDRWCELETPEQRAVLDHELTHLEVVHDADGAIALDDALRPKLKMRLHDVQLGGFYSIIDRHKMAAIEAQTYRDIHHEMTQRTFPWG